MQTDRRSSSDSQSECTQVELNRQLARAEEERANLASAMQLFQREVVISPDELLRRHPGTLIVYAYETMESERPLSVAEVPLSHQTTDEVDGHVYLYTPSHWIRQLNANQRAVPVEVRGVEFLLSTRDITDRARRLDRLPRLDLQALFQASPQHDRVGESGGGIFSLEAMQGEENNTLQRVSWRASLPVFLQLFTAARPVPPL